MDRIELKIKVGLDENDDWFVEHNIENVLNFFSETDQGTTIRDFSEHAMAIDLAKEILSSLYVNGDLKMGSIIGRGFEDGSGVCHETVTQLGSPTGFFFYESQMAGGISGSGFGWGDTAKGSGQVDGTGTDEEIPF